MAVWMDTVSSSKYPTVNQDQWAPTEPRHPTPSSPPPFVAAADVFGAADEDLAEDNATGAREFAQINTLHRSRKIPKTRLYTMKDENFSIISLI